MTDDDYKQFLLFKLMDYDLTGIKYMAIDFDGEIAVSKYTMYIETNHDTGINNLYWVSKNNKDPSNSKQSQCTGIFVDTVPENYSTMVIEL